MLKKLILPIIFVIVGVGLVSASIYIDSQINAGKKELAQGKEKLKKSKRIFSLHPVTKPIEQGIDKYGQEKINAGIEKIKYYEKISFWLLSSGIALIIIGGVLIFFKRARF